MEPNKRLPGFCQHGVNIACCYQCDGIRKAKKKDYKPVKMTT